MRIIHIRCLYTNALALQVKGLITELIARSLVTFQSTVKHGRHDRCHGSQRQPELRREVPLSAVQISRLRVGIGDVSPMRPDSCPQSSRPRLGSL